MASSAARKKIEAVLPAAGFSLGDFDAVLSGTEVARNKPAPDVFIAAASAIGVPPENCVVLEDSPAGVRASVAAGILPV